MTTSTPHQEATTFDTPNLAGSNEPLSVERLEQRLAHKVGQAIADFKLIESGDRILACLSGGKDSWTLIHLLNALQKKSPVPFTLKVLTLDQGQPNFDDTALRNYLAAREIDFEVLREDTYAIVTEKLTPDQTYCSLCSRLRRGIIYSYAKKHGFTKIALGHHRDDAIHSLLMSILYSGAIESMPPKLLSDDGGNIVIRPLIHCREDVISEFAAAMKFPIIPCNLCGSQENLMRKKVKALVAELARDNPNVPGNIYGALSRVNVSQLLDQRHFNFRGLTAKRDDVKVDSSHSQRPPNL